MDQDFLKDVADGRYSIGDLAKAVASILDKDARHGHRCDALCESIIRLYQEEQLSLVATGARFGLSGAAVWFRLKKHDITLRRGGGARAIRSPWKDRALQLWNAGQTLQAIGGMIGVSRERIRQVLQQTGIVTKSRRGHRCTDVCAIALAATPPVSVTGLARKHGISWGRMQRAVSIHGILTSHCHHVCTERCDSIRELLATNMPFRQIAQRLGYSVSTISQRYFTYHPEWNWSRKRQHRPVEGLRVTKHIYKKD